MDNPTPNRQFNQASEGSSIASGGGTAASGGGVAVGRDVGGDVIVINNPRSPASRETQRGLTILRDKVYQFWVQGVLEKSVHHAALDLIKVTQPHAVASPWEKILEVPDQSPQTLPPGTSIASVFEERDRTLLILGEPGSGKTITLLELARDLIANVKTNPDQPVPVVLNLSSWRQGQTLQAWLVEELLEKYKIPRRLSRDWLVDYRLLPLLDGLDEVQTTDRAACVKAINTFGAEYGWIGLVVCCRAAEYDALPTYLNLGGAIRLEPLTPEQVTDYVESWFLRILCEITVAKRVDAKNVCATNRTWLVRTSGV